MKKETDHSTDNRKKDTIEIRQATSIRVLPICNLVVFCGEKGRAFG
jgi:hypothetical protein